MPSTERNLDGTADSSVAVAELSECDETQVTNSIVTTVIALLGFATIVAALLDWKP